MIITFLKAHKLIYTLMIISSNIKLTKYIDVM